MPLTKKQIAEAPAGMHKDSPCLYLSVKETGTSSWVARLHTEGRERWVGLGSTIFTTPTQARDATIDLRRALRSGMTLTDAVQAHAPAGRRRAKATHAPLQPTLAKALEATLQARADGWSNPDKHAQHWRGLIHRHASALLDTPVDQINAATVTPILQPLWNNKRETSTRLLQRLTAVVDYAISRGWRADPLPVNAIRAGLGRQIDTRQHMKAIDWLELPTLYTSLTISNSPSAPALRFQILTAARPGEVRFADTSEIDGDTWRIPAARMKMKRDHRVPLPPQAHKLIRSGSGLLFPSSRNKPFSENTFGKLLRTSGYDVTAHGMRSAFKEWARAGGYDDELSELALAHVVGSSTRRAYARDDLLEQRRPMMEDWARFLTRIAP